MGIQHCETVVVKIVTNDGNKRVRACSDPGGATNRKKFACARYGAKSNALFMHEEESKIQLQTP